MIGQNQTVERLREAGRNGAFHHAYLFVGPDGTGKAEMARWLAQLANCERGGSDEAPCGVCRQCRLIEAGAHPDVLRVEPDPEKSKAGKIIIEQARMVRTEVSRRPVVGRRKVVVISPAGELTLEAVNCLLKTLEEPPDYATLVLLAPDTGSVIPTVLSRCQVMRFAQVPEGEIAAWLAEQGAPAERAAAIAHLAMGRPGEAMRLWKDEAALPRRARSLNLMADIAGASMPDALRLAEKLREGDSADVTEALYWSGTWFRDLLAAQAGLDAPSFVNADKAEAVRAAAAAYPPEQVHAAVEAVRNARRYLAGNGNAALVTEGLVIGLIPGGTQG